MTKRFRTKPVEVEAIQYDGEMKTATELFLWTEGNFDLFIKGGQEQILSMAEEADTIIYGPSTLYAMVYDVLHTTWINVSPGQWIIKGTKGEFYPCDPETFAWKYEEVREG